MPFGTKACVDLVPGLKTDEERGDYCGAIIRTANWELFFEKSNRGDFNHA